ncbi:hypothetical protein DPMN_116964 [Dreissena polymorpha]|uniref:Uncharacterized protein n=1 Tax=Dreissena polymorpha TaxID=45954 RepID=A0A9D4KQT2_DREPO|nr:hypothetical protein DPMN_116964 [Dreissena polymorpha]
METLALCAKVAVCCRSSRLPLRLPCIEVSAAQILRLVPSCYGQDCSNRSVAKMQV